MFTFLLKSRVAARRSAYVEYTGLAKADVSIVYSGDKIVDYLALKKEKKVNCEEQLTHSYEVIAYMDSQGYSLISMSQKYEPSTLNASRYWLTLLFKKENK